MLSILFINCLVSVPSLAPCPSLKRDLIFIAWMIDRGVWCFKFWIRDFTRENLYSRMIIQEGVIISLWNRISSALTHTTLHKRWLITKAHPDFPSLQQLCCLPWTLLFSISLMFLGLKYMVFKPQGGHWVVSNFLGTWIALEKGASFKLAFYLWILNFSQNLVNNDLGKFGKCQEKILLLQVNENIRGIINTNLNKDY